RRVTDIQSGGGSSSPQYLVPLNEMVLFSANDGFGVQLWRSDGREAGTWPVTGTNGAQIPSPLWFSAAGDRVYFSAPSATIGYELSRTDGTSNNTYLVKDISPGPPSSTPLIGATLDGFSLLAA